VKNYGDQVSVINPAPQSFSGRPGDGSGKRKPCKGRRTRWTTGGNGNNSWCRYQERAEIVKAKANTVTVLRTVMAKMSA
jgi:hypothetical protein